MIDAVRIGPKLYMGSFPAPGPDVGRSGFRLLILAAEEREPQLLVNAYPGVAVLPAPLDDGPLTGAMLETARFAAVHVVAAVSRSIRTLVTCNQGRNRSGLIVALALHCLTGWPGPAVRYHIQRLRRGALTNPWFAGYVDNLTALPRSAMLSVGR